MLKKKIGLYIHIPFCEKKCYYCDFLSYTNKNNKDIELYMNSLKKELYIYSKELKDYSIETIFIGGGTPSYIDARYIKDLMDFIKNNFDLSILKEVTIETNPGTLDLEKAVEYRKAGINRVSVGLQTSDIKMLKLIGRTHSLEDFKNSFKILRKAGFDNINVDLIFGLPGQTFEDVLVDLNYISEFKTEHISYYALILEEGTPMYKWAEEDSFEFPTDEEDREMYHKTIEFLENKGYKHYEISNFAKEGKESIHNKLYWEIKPYIGVGVGSHSNFKNKRFWNTSNFKEYIDSLKNNKLAIVGEENIDLEMEIAEYSIFGIRFIDGINKKDFKERFNLEIYDIYKDEIEKHIKNGLLEDRGDYIKLTKRGLDLANLVEMDFLP